MTDRRMEERRKFILAFKESLLCLEDEGDRADIMRALKEFQTTMLVEDLVDSLKRALINPQSLAVYVTLYPLIPGRLRAEYRTLIPKVPTFTVKIIRIRRNGTEPLGFTIRGGREHQLGTEQNTRIRHYKYFRLYVQTISELHTNTCSYIS